MRKKARRALVMLVIALVLAVGALNIVATRVISRPKIPTLQAVPQVLSDEWTAETAKTHDIWWVPPSDEKAAIVMVHGYGQSRLDLLVLAEHLHERGFGVAVLELPYADKSEPYSGGPKEARAVIDTVEWIRSQGHEAALLGFSAGGFASTLAVARGAKVMALVSDSAFVSSTTTFRRESADTTNVPPPFFFPLKTAYRVFADGGRLTDLRDQIDTDWDTPTLVIHGSADRLIPVSDAEVIVKLTKAQKWIVPGLDHGGAWFADRIEYEDRVTDFIGRHTLKRG